MVEQQQWDEIQKRAMALSRATGTYHSMSHVIRESVPLIVEHLDKQLETLRK